MSGARHTVGTWRVLDEDGVYVPHEGRSIRVAYVDPCFIQCGDDAPASAAMRAANASLIAAAPDLLMGCKRALDLLAPFDDPDLSLGLGSKAITPIRKAIANAQGSAEDTSFERLISAAPDLLSALKAMVLNDTHTYRDCHKAALKAIAKAETP